MGEYCDQRRQHFGEGNNTVTKGDSTLVTGRILWPKDKYCVRGGLQLSDSRNWSLLEPISKFHHSSLHRLLCSLCESEKKKVMFDIFLPVVESTEEAWFLG